MPKNFVKQHFSVPLIWSIEKFYASEGCVTIFHFLSTFPCFTVPKNFIGKSFCAVFQKLSGSEKVYGQEGGFQHFLSKIFCLTVPKSFVGESFTVALISGTEKVWIKEGGSIKIFRQIFFV